MTLAGSPALDLAIASLTGRGRASAADSKFSKIPWAPPHFLQKITYFLPASPHLDLPPSPYLPITSPSTPRVWSCPFPCEEKGLFLRPEEEVPSTSEAALAAASIPRESLAASIFFFSVIAEQLARARPVCPPVVSLGQSVSQSASQPVRHSTPAPAKFACLPGPT